jgi:hypothetical protein
MFTVTAHIDDGFTRGTVVPLIRFQRSTSLRLMAQAVADGIIERTDEGVDSNLQPFTPYAGLTLELKSHRGQRLDPPNLRDTGRMMDSIRLVGGTFLTVADAESADKAMKHQWGGSSEGHVIPQRRFFDAREEDVRAGEIAIAQALTLGVAAPTEV